MDLSEIIKSIRTENNLTQEKFANSIGISRSSLTQIETGKANPTVEIISNIIKTYNVDPATFFLTRKVVPKQVPNENLNNNIENLNNNKNKWKDDNVKQSNNDDNKTYLNSSIVFSLLDRLDFVTKTLMKISNNLMLNGHKFEWFDIRLINTVFLNDLMYKNAIYNNNNDFVDRIDTESYLFISRAIKFGEDFISRYIDSLFENKEEPFLDYLDKLNEDNEEYKEMRGKNRS